MKKAILTVFLAIAALLALIFFACKKDRFEEPNSKQSTLPISVEEVKQILGDPSSGLVSSRSPIKVPLHFTPNWENAILNMQTGAPLVIAGVDTCCLPLNMPANGNLIFRKNITGSIECSLVLWFKSPGSTYNDWLAPLWTQSTFNGLVVLLDAQDTIRRVASYANGSINKVLVWNKNIRDLAEDEFGASPTVEDRAPDPKCPRWGRSIWDKIGDFLLEVLDGLGAFFSDRGSNNGNNTGQQNPYSFFFDFSNSTNTWTWTGGGGGASQTAFENYRVECGIARQNFIANGFYLPEYAHLDMGLCELLSELYVFDNSQSANIRLQCLYANHQSTYFEEIWQYWENSGKDQYARNVLNSFLDAACGENPSVQKAEMLRYTYCLGNVNLVNLWNRLTAQCGQNFGLDISPCLAEFILRNASTSSSYHCTNGALGNIINFARQHSLTGQQFLVLVQNEALFQQVKSLVEKLNPNQSDIGFLISQPSLVAQIVNFLQGHAGNEPAKVIAKYVIQELHTDPSIPSNTDLSQYNFFDDFDPLISYLESNTESENEINNGIEIEYIVQAPSPSPPPPPAGRLLGGAPENPNGGQDAIGRTSGDLNILPPHVRQLDNHPEWDLKSKMKFLFFMATNGDVDEILDGMGDEVRDAYISNFFGNKNGTFFKYQNNTLHLMVKKSKKIKNWLKEFGFQLNKRLKVTNGSIGTIENVILDERVHLNETKSLTILINDTQKTDVYIINH